MYNERTTICISASRSYAKLAKTIIDLNDLCYSHELASEDRIEFKDVYDKGGNLTHFEVTGSPLDFFQIGLRYGHMVEKESMQPYLKDFYRSAMATKQL